MPRLPVGPGGHLLDLRRLQRLQEPAIGGSTLAMFGGARCGHVSRTGGSFTLGRQYLWRMELRPIPGMHRHPSTDFFELASSDYVSGEELAELAASEYPWVVRAVAANRRTPAPVLRDLVPVSAGGENDRELMCVLLKNPSLPAELVGHLVLTLMRVLDPHHHDMIFEAVVRAFSRPDAPEEVLIEVLHHPSATRHFRTETAKVAVGPRVRSALATDPSSRVRDALAGNSTGLTAPRIPFDRSSV